MSAPARAKARGRVPRVGTAGWAIRKEHAALFPGPGTHLERYARRFNAVEINSSFYRPHRRTTYEKWATSTPGDFAFSVKCPKEITHTRRLVAAESTFCAFLDQASGLGSKLGVLLIQLPPNLVFDTVIADRFFAMVRHHHLGNVVCEPRHVTWFSPSAEELLVEHWIGRVAADPPIVPEGAEPGAWPDVRYFRLHGSPRVYRSRYDADRIAAWAERVRVAGGRAWCVFDNTAEAAATENAFELAAILR